MSKVPNLPYTQIIAALERDGWIVVRQRGSHIRLEKSIPDEVLKLTVLLIVVKVTLFGSNFTNLKLKSRKINYP
ncbi:MAG: type II toxin-antitoxin system HicA family toxin [Nostoc sp.]|uniref:type II toxin-antitoxin system HicA family toxin n=1 Tax=Nostoc sp. TaxID=1180 RepID=UPI002FFCD815